MNNYTQVCQCEICQKNDFKTCADRREFIPYTIKEAKYAAYNNKMDIYHKELILWLCDELEKVRK